jgi:predicted ABC-class ATPase
MLQSRHLNNTLSRIDKKGYKAYKDIQDSYRFDEENFVLHIDYVQGDPFASPSKARVVLPQKVAGFPEECYENRSREIATRDFLTRQFATAIKKHSKGSRGTGKSGKIGIDQPGQEILERTSAFINAEEVEVRFTLSLPAFGRKIAGREAKAMFFEEIPAIVREALLYENIDSEYLTNHYQTNEDADFIRERLKADNLIAFVGNSAILPRQSGINQKPMDPSQAIPFKSPESMMVELELPNSGKVYGLGIPQGITMIVGGGFHGKSTLLNALEKGVYNHIPGDGREFVISNDNAVKIRSEDGRRIEKVDISPFINNLPLGKSTKDFSTEDASGSTSQATNIIESIEAGAEVMLIDEDTSATNFMIRDQRMQQLIHKNEEPITPFIDKVQSMKTDYDISTILVMGGSGDYFDVADFVIGMNNYKPVDLTQQVENIRNSQKSNRTAEGGEGFGEIYKRAPFANSIKPEKGKKRKKIKTMGKNAIQFGMFTIDLSAVEQIVDPSQVTAIGEALVYCKKYMDGRRTIHEILDLVFKDIEEKGLNVIGHSTQGDYAEFRRHELAAALNRLRSLKVK